MGFSAPLFLIFAMTPTWLFKERGYIKSKLRSALTSAAPASRVDHIIFVIPFFKDVASFFLGLSVIFIPGVVGTSPTEHEKNYDENCYS